MSFLRRLDKLNNQDLLDKKHFPVQALFNELYIDQFLDTVVNYISEGHGFGTEYGACIFPDDLDEYEISTRGTFKGVEFGLHNGEEILLDYSTFYYYLCKVCFRYCENFPENRLKIEDTLKKFRSKFMIV